MWRGRESSQSFSHPESDRFGYLPRTPMTQSPIHEMMDFETFTRLADDASVIPVSQEFLADGLGPVQAYATVRGKPGSYLLESVVGGERRARYSFVGFDPDVRVTVLNDRFKSVTREGVVRDHPCEDPWDRLRQMMAEYRPAQIEGLPPFWGGAVGYVSYDAVRRFEPHVDGKNPPLPGGNEFEFAIGGTVLVFDNARQTLRIVVAALLEGDRGLRAVYDNALVRIDEVKRVLASPVPLPLRAAPGAKHDVVLPPSSFTREDYCAAVKTCQEHIVAGDIFQVVLSQQFATPAKAPLFDVYRGMRALNPSPYMYFLDFDSTKIAGASPETLVRVVDGVAEVRPIAGTRPRGRNAEEDAEIEKDLFSDPKEVAEHVMLVDLGRNDIGRISKPGTVRITERMVAERYSHVMHITSGVTGELAPGRDAIDVLRATFPAGTLSGAPKVRAMQIIEALEPVRRGIYGGAVGYLGFDGTMDVAIAIRTIVERDGIQFVQAGAGVVEASEPESEFQETVNKARAALLSIAAAEDAL